MKLHPIDEEILRYLHEHPWSFSLELQDGLQTQRRARGKMGFLSRLCWVFGAERFSEMFQTPGFGELYVSFDRMERPRSGAPLLESRWRDEPPEALVVRGGHRRREYNLTPDGAPIAELLVKNPGWTLEAIGARRQDVADTQEEMRVMGFPETFIQGGSR